MAFDAPVAICREKNGNMVCGGFEGENNPVPSPANPTQSATFFGIDFGSHTPVGEQAFALFKSTAASLLRSYAAALHGDQYVTFQQGRH